MYRNSKRSVIVVHNGHEGYRGAIKIFEEEKEKIQKELEGHLLLREIGRWDIEELTNRFFEKRDDFQKAEEFEIMLNILRGHERINVDFEQKAERILSDPEVEKTAYKELISEQLGAIKKIKGTFALEKFADEGTYDK